MLWKFAPIDRAIDNILPKFNNTGDSGYVFGDFGNISHSTDSDDLFSSGEGTTYEFMQCKKGKTCCNGLNDICDLRVDEILYATAHNAMASFDDGFLFSPNHRFSLEKALEAGYRGINLDLCNCEGRHVFCHGYCSMGSREVVDVFTSINMFLSSNPTEILMIPIEINNDADEPVVIDQFFDQLQQVPGFVDKLYSHGDDPSSPWPTLKTSLESNKRVFMFQYKGQCGDFLHPPCPKELNSYEQYAINTKWQFEQLGDIEDTSTSCAPRSGVPFTDTHAFFGINSFVTPPIQEVSRKLNSLKFASKRIRDCSQRIGMDPNFIYADFWSEGDLPQVVQEHNKDLGRRRLLNRKNSIRRHSWGRN